MTSDKPTAYTPKTLKGENETQMPPINVGPIQTPVKPNQPAKKTSIPTLA